MAEDPQSYYRSMLDQIEVRIASGEGVSPEERDSLAAVVYGRQFPDAQAAVQMDSRARAARLMIRAGYGTIAISQLSGLPHGAILGMLHR